MTPPGPRQRIVCLVGPTASGKSSLALELAVELGAEIVSADSRQVYWGLDIGTAKPTPAERARVPHHLLDVVEPTETFDAARFRSAAAAALAAIQARGRPALVVGGTGLYVRVLLRGLCPAPPRVPRLRAVLADLAASRGAPALHRGLVAVDPATAARVHPHDVVRIVRALEVALASGRRLSDWQAAHRFGDAPYDALVIGLARPVAELDARIAARAQAMFAAGFVDEVRALRARGIPADAPGLRTVGYRELLAANPEGDDAAVLPAVVRATRRFAKRQRTWFRREPGIVWRHPEHDWGGIAAEVAAFLQGAAPALPAAS
jgi:tRNA dimethylallyltransferase